LGGLPMDWLPLDWQVVFVRLWLWLWTHITLETLASFFTFSVVTSIFATYLAGRRFKKEFKQRDRQHKETLAAQVAEISALKRQHEEALAAHQKRHEEWLEAHQVEVSAIKRIGEAANFVTQRSLLLELTARHTLERIKRAAPEEREEELSRMAAQISTAVLEFRVIGVPNYMQMADALTEYLMSLKRASVDRAQGNEVEERRAAASRCVFGLSDAYFGDVKKSSRVNIHDQSNSKVAAHP